MVESGLLPVLGSGPPFLAGREVGGWGPSVFGPTVASHFFMASHLLIQRAYPAAARTLAVSLIRDWVMEGWFVQPLRGTRPSQYHHSSHPDGVGQFGR